MASNFREQRFAAKKKADKRKENIRTEKSVEGDLPKVVFSFKDFDKSQIPPGQTFEDWQEKGCLAYLMEKLCHISELNMIEAKQQKYITYMIHSRSNLIFSIPDTLPLMSVGP